jgi:putative ABC transport system permease protein
VQGIEVRTVIASLREIDWGRLEPNFFVVFEPGALERAPQMMATLARIDDPVHRGTLQRHLAESFPNVTSLDLSLLQNAIQNIIDRVALAIRFMAGFSLLTGAIVLIGAVSTNRFQRIREAVLLKTLGATRRQVLRIILTEYAALGLLATAISVILASAAGWALATFVFETTFRVPLPQLVALTSGLVALTLGVGLWSSATILKRTPLEVLRSE